MFKWVYIWIMVWILIWTHTMTFQWLLTIHNENHTKIHTQIHTTKISQTVILMLEGRGREGGKREREREVRQAEQSLQLPPSPFWFKNWPNIRQCGNTSGFSALCALSHTRWSNRRTQIRDQRARRHWHRWRRTPRCAACPLACLLPCRAVNAHLGLDIVFLAWVPRKGGSNEERERERERKRKHERDMVHLMTSIKHINQPSVMGGQPTTFRMC